jgi:hypothetical protein
MRDDLITIAQQCLPWKADMIQAALRGYGVESELRNDYAAALGVHYGIATGGARVMVAPEDLHAARQVLKQLETAAGEDGIEIEDSEALPLDEAISTSSERQCPACRGSDFVLQYNPRPGGLLGKVLLSVLGPPHQQWVCSSCDAHWSP